MDNEWESVRPRSGGASELPCEATGSRRAIRVKIFPALFPQIPGTDVASYREKSRPEPEAETSASTRARQQDACPDKATPHRNRQKSNVVGSSVAHQQLQSRHFGGQPPHRIQSREDDDSVHSLL